MLSSQINFEMIQFIQTRLQKYILSLESWLKTDLISSRSSSIQDFYLLLSTKKHRGTNKLFQSGSNCIQYLWSCPSFLIKQTQCSEINFLSDDTALFYDHCLSEATPFCSYPVIHCTAVWCPQEHL